MTTLTQSLKTLDLIKPYNYYETTVDSTVFHLYPLLTSDHPHLSGFYGAMAVFKINENEKYQLNQENFVGFIFDYQNQENNIDNQTDYLFEKMNDNEKQFVIQYKQFVKDSHRHYDSTFKSVLSKNNKSFLFVEKADFKTNTYGALCHILDLAHEIDSAKSIYEHLFETNCGKHGFLEYSVEKLDFKTGLSKRHTEYFYLTDYEPYEDHPDFENGDIAINSYSMYGRKKEITFSLVPTLKIVTDSDQDILI